MYAAAQGTKDTGQDEEGPDRSGRVPYRAAGDVPSIRFLTRSPISFIHALTLSRSRGSGHVAFFSVLCRSSFMYALSSSASNVGRGEGAVLGRGEGALERGVVGERSPEAIVVAIEVVRVASQSQR